jgi:hypothetical protein
MLAGGFESGEEGAILSAVGWATARLFKAAIVPIILLPYAANS